jgi:hypothetical protein
MTHGKWHAMIHKSLAMAEAHPARALKSLHKLLDRLQSDAKTLSGDWHIDQTLEVVSIVHSHHREHRQSAETILRVADRYEQQSSYYRRAFVAACATAALELASAGSRPGALQALRRARPLAAGLRPPEKLFRKAEQAVAAMARSSRKRRVRRTS